MPNLDGICVRKEMIGGRLALVPADEHAAEEIAKLPEKKDIMAVFRTPRSLEFHKFVFGYFKKVLEHTDGIWKDKDDLLDAVKFATGHTSRFRRIGNPHAQDLQLADEIGRTSLYYIDDKGNITQVPMTWKTKIIMALRRGADEYITRTKSISFESMGQEKFKEFYKKTVEALNTFLGWDTSTLMDRKNDSA